MAGEEENEGSVVLKSEGVQAGVGGGVEGAAGGRDSQEQCLMGGEQ